MTAKDTLSDEALLEIRRAYHSLEAFQLSPEHRKAKAALKVRLAKQKSEEGTPTAEVLKKIIHLPVRDIPPSGENTLK